MSTTERKPMPPCRAPGCKEPAIDVVPVWGQYWNPDREEIREGWGDQPFCTEHFRGAEGVALERRLDELVAPYPRMRGWTFDTFPVYDPAGAAALARAREWVEHESDSRPLFIFGEQGRRKTSLALSCLRAKVNAWDGARLFNVRQLLADTRRSFGSKGAADPLDELVDTYYVALDDVGAERPTPWAVETLASIVDRRYVRELPTIVTSNYAPSELARLLGHDDPVIGLRIVSRLTERAVQIRLEGPDMRMQFEPDPEPLLDPFGPHDDAGDAPAGTSTT